MPAADMVLHSGDPMNRSAPLFSRFFDILLPALSAVLIGLAAWFSLTPPAR